jgi:hypothetical protein
MIAVGSGQCARSYALARWPVSVLTEGYDLRYVRRCSVRDRDQVLTGNLVVCVVQLFRVRNKYCTGNPKLALVLTHSGVRPRIAF